MPALPSNESLGAWSWAVWSAGEDGSGKGFCACPWAVHGCGQEFRVIDLEQITPGVAREPMLSSNHECVLEGGVSFTIFSNCLRHLYLGLRAAGGLELTKTWACNACSNAAYFVQPENTSGYT